LARNRYGWQKRSKELARKQKNDDKMKRRQGKAPLEEVEEGMPGTEEMLGAEDILGTEAPDLDSLPETDPAGPTQPH
jgi:hypothetical protein